METSPSPAKPYQFSLRSLMLLMTAVASVAAAIAWRGPGGAFPVLLAILLLANWRGFFRRWQEGKSALRLAWVVFGVFVVSLVSPCAKGCNNEKISGWRLAIASATIPLDDLAKVANDAERRAEVAREPRRWLTSQLIFLSLFLVNLLLVSAVGLPWLLRREWARRWLPPCVALGTTAMAMFVWTNQTSSSFGDFLFGFWFWMAAGWLLTILVPTNRRALVVALTAAIIFSFVN